MKSFIQALAALALLVAAPAFAQTTCNGAGLANPVMFVTQYPVAADFATIGSVFANHRGSLSSAGRGGHLWIASIPRIPDASLDPTAKNYNWIDLNRGLMEAQDHGFDTTVLCDAAGLVTEGPGFNVFVVKGATVSTSGHGVLEGITRRSVLDLCPELGLIPRVGPITRAELEEADEVFLASTAGGVMPISRVNGRIMNNDSPGPVSRRMKELYWQAHARPEWRTPVRGSLSA